MLRPSSAENMASAKFINAQHLKNARDGAVSAERSATRWLWLGGVLPDRFGGSRARARGRRYLLEAQAHTDAAEKLVQVAEIVK